MVKPKQKKQKIIAVFIAYNAERTLEKFYRDFPKRLVDEIILVDDKSTDNTYALAKRLGIRTYQNPTNLGYGGNLKRALAIALRGGADIIIDIHPDGEYKPNAIEPAIQRINRGAVLVLGKRWDTISDLRERGMYWWKIPFLVGMTLMHKIFLGTKIKDIHQGFRVYTRKLLENIAFEKGSNSYLFSFEIIAQALFRGSLIAEVPVETSYTGKKRGASFKSSIQYSLGTFKIVGLYLLARVGVPIKLFEKPSKNPNRFRV